MVNKEAWQNGNLNNLSALNSIFPFENTVHKQEPSNIQSANYQVKVKFKAPTKQKKGNKST